MPLGGFARDTCVDGNEARHFNAPLAKGLLRKALKMSVNSNCRSKIKTNSLAGLTGLSIAMDAFNSKQTSACLHWFKVMAVPKKRYAFALIKNLVFLFYNLNEQRSISIGSFDVAVEFRRTSSVSYVKSGREREVHMKSRGSLELFSDLPIGIS